MEFFKQILPESGFPVIAIKRDGYFEHRMCRDIDDLSQQLKEYKEDAPLYFAISTYAEFKTGSTNVRTMKNFHATKCLWTEFDVREDGGKSYETLEECMDGLRVLRETLGLPEPTLVDSGGGIHVYWHLTSEIGMDEWRNLSNSLIICAHHMGIKIDIAGTNKATQVFRPPESTNEKYGKKVELMWEGDAIAPSKIRNLFAIYMEEYGLSVASLNSKKCDIDVKDFEYREWKPIYDTCAQIRNAAFGTEEQWRGLLSTARICRCENGVFGRELAHVESQRDPDQYDEAKTEDKLNNLDEQQGVVGMPYSCEKWRQLDPSLCEDCPKFGRIKNPIVLGIVDRAITFYEEIDLENFDIEILDEDGTGVVSSADDVNDTGMKIPVVDTALRNIVELSPDGDMFKLVKQGFLVKTKTVDKKTGEVTEFNDIMCDQRLYPIDIILSKDESNNTIYSYMWRIELEHGQINDVIIQADVFTASQALISVFAKLGVNVVKANHVPLFSLGVRTFIQAARIKMKPILVKKSLGWHTDEFIFGERSVTKDMVIRDAILDGEARSLVANTFEKKGTYQGWKDAVALYSNPSQITGQFILAVAFGAPLMKFSTVDGLLISLVGESGCGKSTMQKVSASVYGNENQLQNSLGTRTGDTMLSTTRYAGVAKHLPIHLEEVSNLGDKLASDLAYMITQGSEKNRMQRGENDGFKRSLGLSWSTIFTSSSNESVVDKINRGKPDAIAEGMRIFEIKDMPKISKKWVDDGIAIESITSNYGHAGEVFATWLMSNRGELEGWVSAQAKVLNERMDASSPERFWIQGLACVLVGALIAKNAGIFDFDIEKLNEFIDQQFNAQRNRSAETKVIAKTSASFSDMLNEMLGETLVVDVEDGSSITQLVSKPQRGVLSARLNIATHEVFIAVNRIRKYCKDNQTSMNQILKDALESGYFKNNVMKTSKVSLGDGVTSYMTGKSLCYTFEIPSDEIEPTLDQLNEVSV